MARKPRRDQPAKPRHAAAEPEPTTLRIIGGRFRGRKLIYSGDPRTRPMKERVREAVFNLVGPSVEGTHAIDLFAGTGALALEALSRGAASATLVEQHFPSARAIRDNLAALGLEHAAEVIAADTFRWARRARLPADRPWLVFCSPPYLYYATRGEEIVAMLQDLIEAAPAASIFVVESDRRLDVAQLPRAAAWDHRAYPPARVGMYRKPASPETP